MSDAAVGVCARLDLGATSAVAGDRLEYSVLNTGSLPIVVGEAFGLDRLEDDEWVAVEVPYKFRLWGRRLNSGESFALTARIPDGTRIGRYRLNKRLVVDRDPQPGYEAIAQLDIPPTVARGEFDVLNS